MVGDVRELARFLSETRGGRRAAGLPVVRVVMSALSPRLMKRRHGRDPKTLPDGGWL
jgi:hypothetical protein